MINIADKLHAATAEGMLVNANEVDGLNQAAVQAVQNSEIMDLIYAGL